jgi:hypothetical protein
MSTKSTTIRITEETKKEIENLDFVKKDTFDSILNKLIEFYNTSKSKDFDGHQKLRISKENKKKV